MFLPLLSFLFTVLMIPAGWAKPVKDVTVTLFEWNYSSVTKECQTTLGPAGYGFVQVSPPQEHIQGAAWWTSYQPVSYKIAGRLGDRNAFIKMINVCHNAGVKVIVDAVINHMSTGAGNGVGTGGSLYAKYQYPGYYQSWDFHSCRNPVTDYSNRENIQQCELENLADLDTGSSYVRTTIAHYLNELIAAGADGFRIDAAKHIAADDLAAIKSQLTNPEIYWVQEVIQGDNEPVQSSEYLSLGPVDEFRYGRDLKRVFEQEKLTYLGNFGEYWDYLPTQKARVFIDNWDTERNDSTLNYRSGANYTLANVFMLAYPYGAPNIYSGYEFDNYDQGPPLRGKVNACYKNGWKCQHRWPQIVNMVAFHNAVAGLPITNWWSNNNNAIAFGRGDIGFVAINHEPFPITATFQTSLPAGVYCDIQHSDPMHDERCTGTLFLINSRGQFTATIDANDAIAFYRS